MASLVAFWLGEFTNSYTLAKMKLWTNGKWLWTRTIGSTLVGEGLDSIIFITLAFVGTIPIDGLASTILTQWVVKVVYEVAATPLTYALVGVLRSGSSVSSAKSLKK